MSGNTIGYLKGKMGLKGKTQPGQMIARMNEMKVSRDSGVKKLSPKVAKIIKKII